MGADEEGIDSEEEEKVDEENGQVELGNLVINYPT